MISSETNSVFVLQGPGISGVPPSGGGFSPGQSQVSTQDQEKVRVSPHPHSQTESHNKKGIACVSNCSQVVEDSLLSIRKCLQTCRAIMST